MDLLPQDDNMDLVSSPFRQQDDIDLDLEPMEEYPENPHPDSMFDDGVENDNAMSEQTQGENEDGIQNDDDMFDEDHQAQDSSALLQHPFVDPSKHIENEMKQVEDEDILYEDDEAQGEEAASDNTQIIADGLPQATQIQVADEDVFEQHQHDDTQSEKDSLEQNHAEEDHTLSRDRYHPQIDISGDQVTDDTKVITSNMNDQSATGYTSERTNIPSATADGRDSDQEQALENDAEPDLTGGVTDQAANETPANISGRYLHPVKVIYQDSELCLFPPTADDASDTFFLPDTSVAYETLDKLLSACREVLAGSIGEHDELVLDVASLGLHISEDSKYATQITLAQILDVYLTLSHNENVGQTDALYCSLTSRVCLATQYAYLAAAAHEGRTFSDIAAEHLASPDDSAIGFEEPSDAETTGSAPPTEVNPTTDLQGLEDMVEDEGHEDNHPGHPTSLDKDNLHDNSIDRVRKDAISQGDANGRSSPVLSDPFDERHSHHMDVHDAATVGDQSGLQVGIESSKKEKTADEDAPDDLTPPDDHQRGHDEVAASKVNLATDHPGNDTPANGMSDAALEPVDGQATLVATEQEPELESDKGDLVDLEIDTLLDEDEGLEQIPDSAYTDAQADLGASAKSDQLALPEYGTMSANDEGFGVDDDHITAELDEEDLFEEVGSPAASQSPPQSGPPINGKNATAVSGVLEPLSKGKRKMRSDEEGLRQLELATPDNKRRRPS